MNKTISAIALVSIAFFTACNTDSDNQNGETHDFPTAISDERPVEGMSLETESGEAIDLQLAQPAQGGNTSGSLALNPPHGEPGHRCEIPVGAPLNSEPATNSDLVQQQIMQDHAQPAPTQPQPVNVGGQTARLNPPHGQPGHDCAVAVGAPLP